MKKLSNEQISAALSEVPGVIRGLVEENAGLREKVAHMQRKEAASELAETMHAKGLELDVGLEDLTARLEKAAEQGKLETYREAVALSGPDMGSKLASLSSSDGNNAAAGSALERFIVGGIG